MSLCEGSRGVRFTMGKKGSWFSAIKRVFTPNSKDRLTDELEKKNPKEKKRRGLGKLKHADSFIPLFREPSSIEKILGEAEQQYHPIEFRPFNTSEQPSTPSIVPFQASTPIQDAPPPQRTPPMETSPPRISSSRNLASPTMASILQRSGSSSSQRFVSSPPINVTPPRNAIPERTVSPPRNAIPERTVSPPRNSITERMVSPPRNSITERTVSPPRNAIHERTVSTPRIASPRKAVSSARAATPSTAVTPARAATPSTAVTPPRSASPWFVHRQRPEPTLRYQHACATKIQAAYRGYKARKSLRALRGLVRLQTVVKGQSARRQTVNAMKSMQLLTRVQIQIQSRRIQMLENRALELKALESQKESDNGETDEWNDSRLTKDEVDARTQKKSEAIIKRERAMAYAYSRQPWKKTPQATLMDIRSSGGYPWWWSWLDRQAKPSTALLKPSQTPSFNNRHPSPYQAHKTASSPLLPDSSSIGSVSGTPRSTRSAAVPGRMRLMSLTPSSRLMGQNKFPRSRPANSSSPFNDGDSLMSCPTFSGPRFMEPTASTIAKTRGGFGESPEVQSKRRVSFPFAQRAGSFRWSRRGSTSSANTTPGRDGGESMKGLERKKSTQSIGSAESTVSMPVGLGRKPFNRFV
ncbi:hypothetical protein V2J09_011262 [Rumex salicifolius]